MQERFYVQAWLVAANRSHAALLTPPGLREGPVRGPGPDGQGRIQICSYSFYYHSEEEK
jgi:hypothetical protein